MSGSLVWYSVSVLSQPSKPGHLFVAAVGSTYPGGYSDPQLSPLIPIQPPADSIWDFDFVGKPPVGVVVNDSGAIDKAFYG
jgi:hypothetical protein